MITLAPVPTHVPSKEELDGRRRLHAEFLQQCEAQGIELNTERRRLFGVGILNGAITRLDQTDTNGEPLFY